MDVPLYEICIEDIPFFLTSCIQFISSFALTFCSFRLGPKFFLLPLVRGHIIEADFNVYYFLEAFSFWVFHLSACLHKTAAHKTSLIKSPFLLFLVGSFSNTIFGWKQLSIQLSESIKVYKDLKVIEIKGCDGNPSVSP